MSAFALSKRAWIGAFLLGLISQAGSSPLPKPGYVTTVAGYGIQGSSYNDINLVSPGLAASDDEGGIYFPDTGNHILYNRDDWNVMAVVAGTGLPGFSGDGGPPREARFYFPKGVAARGGSRVNDPSQFPDIDPNKPVSEIFIADTGNRRIRKIFRGPSGHDIVVTIAGDGSEGYKGDGGPALNAGFISPEGLAVDSSGVLYIADRLDHRVRKIDADGMISTVAGTGVPGDGGDGGDARQAQLNSPSAVLLDKEGHLYISDTGNHRIRRVTADGKITTFLGGGLQVGEGVPPLDLAIQSPTGMALDGDGAFYFTDGYRVRVFRNGPSLFREAQILDYGLLVTRLRESQDPVSAYLFSRFSPQIKERLEAYNPDDFPPAEFKAAFIGALNEVVQGPNLYDAARFSQVDLSETARRLIERNPQGEDLLRLNRMLIDETYPEDIIRNRMDGRVHTFAGNGSGGWLGENVSPHLASFRRPYGLTVPSVERLVITDNEARRVRAVNGFQEENLYVFTVFGKNLWDDTIARSSRLTLPAAVAPGPEGRALIADTGNRRIRSLEPPCSEDLPREPYYLYSVAGKGIPPSGNSTIPCRNLNTLPASYAPTVEGSKAVEAEIGSPTGVAGTLSGGYYFSESENRRVWRVDPQGILHSIEAPGGWQYPTGLALAADGRLFIADRDAAKVWVYDPLKDAASAVSPFAGTEPGDLGEGGAAAQARLNAPEAVAFGPDGAVYIADTGNHKVKRVDPDGTIHTAAGTGHAGFTSAGPALSVPLNAPRGVAVDGDGTLYLSDSLNHRIARVRNGQLEPVSGGSEPGRPAPDPLTGKDLDEWAGESSWYEPAGMAFDGSGNLYIADQRNHRVRVIASAAAAAFSLDPSVLFGDVNEDLRLDVSDAIQTLRIAVGISPATPSQRRKADISPQGAAGRLPGDGAVDIRDTVRLLRRIVGLIPDDQWP